MGFRFRAQGLGFGVHALVLRAQGTSSERGMFPPCPYYASYAYLCNTSNLSAF